MLRLVFFFPKEGVFNQMISTGTFELIKSKKLKTNLLEIYNHQKLEIMQLLLKLIILI